LTTFKVLAVLKGGAIAPGRSIILFLKKNGADLYEPLSGHTFPTDSVYRLQRAGAR
jgi:hypothetical protein